MTIEEFKNLKEYDNTIKTAFRKLLRNEGNNRTAFYYKIKTFKNSLNYITPLFLDYYIFLTNENVIDFTEQIEWLQHTEPLDFSFNQLHPLMKDEFKRLIQEHGYSAKSYNKIFDNLLDYPQILEQFNTKYKEMITLEESKKRLDDIIKKEVDVNIQKLSDIQVDSELFKTIEIDDELLNAFFSRDGGIKKGTTNIIIGDPGSGKTLFSFDLLSKLNSVKSLYISAEMTRVEVLSYTQNLDLSCDFVFLHDYFDSDPFSVIEKVLKQGYDIVVMDSLSEICIALQDSFHNLTLPKIEKELLKLIKEHTKGLTGVYTSFLIIQQVTKNGNFVGGNSLKHNTSSMLHLERYDCQHKRMRFSKNRNADISYELFFKINDGTLEYFEQLDYYDEENEIMEL